MGRYKKNHHPAPDKIKTGGCRNPKGCGIIRCKRCGLPVRDHRIDIPCPFWDDWKEGFQRGGM